MTEFDEIALVRRIRGLYAERLKEKTDADIRKSAKAMSSRLGLAYEKALLALESNLLSENPNPEKWEQ